MQNNLIHQNAQLLHYLRYDTELDKTSLAKKLDISYPTVVKFLDELEGEQIIKKSDKFYTVNPAYGVLIGISIGGGQCKILFLSFDFKIIKINENLDIKPYADKMIERINDILYEFDEKTNQNNNHLNDDNDSVENIAKFTDKGYIFFNTPQNKNIISQILDVICEQIMEINNHSKFNILSIGFACTGIINMNEQIIAECHNIPSLQNTKLTDLIYVDKKSYFEKKNIPCYLIQNSTAACVCEKYALYRKDSKYKDVKNIVTINLEVGLGAGIIQNGQLVLGQSGLAGEIGHNPVQFYSNDTTSYTKLIDRVNKDLEDERNATTEEEKKKFRCSCGKLFCYDHRIRRDVFKMSIDKFAKQSSQDIAFYLKDNSKQEQRILFGQYIGSILNSLSNILDIGLVIFTGKFHDCYYAVQADIIVGRNCNSLQYNHNDCEIYLADDYGASAPAIGAAIAGYHNKYDIEFKWE